MNQLKRGLLTRKEHVRRLVLQDHCMRFPIFWRMQGGWKPEAVERLILVLELVSSYIELHVDSQG